MPLKLLPVQMAFKCSCFEQWASHVAHRGAYRDYDLVSKMSHDKCRYGQVGTLSIYNAGWLAAGPGWWCRQ